MRAIPGSPELVSASCAQLAQHAEELTIRGDGLRAMAAQSAGSWSGAAALAFEAAAGVLGDAFRSAGEELSEVAAAGRDFAADLAIAQREVAALATRESRLAEERVTWQARAASALAVEPAPGAGVHAAAVAAARLDALTAEMARVDALAADTLLSAQAHRDRFVTALQDARPPTRLSTALGVSAKDADQLTEVRSSGTDVLADLGALRALAVARSGGADMARLRQALRAGDLSLLRRADMKALKAFEHFRGPAWARGDPLLDALRNRRLAGGEVAAGGKLLGAAAGRINLVMTAGEGIHDLVHGDPEHPGWRDVTTRVSGGIGAGGAALLLAGGPATWSIGAVAVTAYGAYKFGTLVYDNREAVKNAATAVWQRGSDIASAGVEKVQESWQCATEAVGEQVGNVVQGVQNAADGARDAISGLGERLGSLPRLGWGR